MTTEAKEKLDILLVEDSPADIRLIRELLTDMETTTGNVHNADTLSGGLACLEQGQYDLVLLDLSLPDSQGLTTLDRLLDRFSDSTVVVLTGFEDKDAAFAAIKKGAQDYLPKGELNSILLERTIRYAVERAGLLARLEQALLHKQQVRELRSLDLFSRTKTEITSQVYGIRPLQESAMETFNELAGQYENLLDMALEKRIYKKDHGISEHVHSLGDRLGFLSAGPRDVIDIYMHAMQAKSTNTNPQKMQAYSEEGRILLIEIMGRLVLFYRYYYAQTQSEKK